MYATPGHTLYTVLYYAPLSNGSGFCRRNMHVFCTRQHFCWLCCIVRLPVNVDFKVTHSMRDPKYHKLKSIRPTIHRFMLYIKDSMMVLESCQPWNLPYGWVWNISIHTGEYTMDVSLVKWRCPAKRQWIKKCRKVLEGNGSIDIKQENASIM